MDELVKRASGQFIYASTVVKYITSPHRHPVEHLEIILKLCINPSEHDLPFKFVQLDALFWHIFSSIPPHDRELVMTIVGALVVDVASHYLLRSTQGLSEFFVLPVANVELLLGNLSSIVKIHASDFHKGGVRASYHILFLYHIYQAHHIPWKIVKRRTTTSLQYLRSSKNVELISSIKSGKFKSIIVKIQWKDLKDTKFYQRSPPPISNISSALYM